MPKLLIFWFNHKNRAEIQDKVKCCIITSKAA